MKSLEEQKRMLEVQEVSLEEAADGLLSRRQMLGGIGKTARGLALMAGVLTISSAALVGCDCVGACAAVDIKCTTTCAQSGCQPGDVALIGATSKNKTDHSR